MSLTALLLAAVISDPVAVRNAPKLAAPRGPLNCDTFVTEPVAKRSSGRKYKLGKLPKAHQDETVLKIVRGCILSTTVRQNVEGDGSFGEDPVPETELAPPEAQMEAEAIAPPTSQMNYP